MLKYLVSKQQKKYCEHPLKHKEFKLPDELSQCSKLAKYHVYEEFESSN